jgi:hypothetical protein
LFLPVINILMIRNALEKAVITIAAVMITKRKRGE